MNKAINRNDILETYTDDASVIHTLLAYTENKFSNALNNINLLNIPLPDEPYVETWSEYLNEASEERKLFDVLRSKIIQLRFPVEKNISRAEIYRNAVLKGIFTSPGDSLNLKSPDSISLRLYQTIAGKIPVLIIPDPEDFQKTIQALLYKNEPVPVPQSMGAAMISGLNNWSRIEKYKRAWNTGNANGNWSNEFINNVIPKKEIYQDKLIILSKKNYSNTFAHMLNIDETAWPEYSLQIRLEHECAHFFTARFLGCMANNLHDELIADYMGIIKVTGKFRADWFLQFTGLENYPVYRAGGRLENYTGEIKVSTPAFNILTAITRNAALNVEKFDAVAGTSDHSLDKAIRLLTLCSVDLLSMSTGEGLAQLIYNYKTYLKKLPD